MMNGPSPNETWESYFAELHRASIELKESKSAQKEATEDFDDVEILEESSECPDLAKLPHSGASNLSPKDAAAGAIQRGWEVRASKNVSLTRGRLTSTGRQYADKTYKNTWMEARIEGKPFAFRAHWTGTSFQGASCWGIQDAAFIMKDGKIERAVKYLTDAEEFAYFIHSKGLFMNPGQIQDMLDKRADAKVRKKIAKQEKERAERGGVDVIAG